MIENTPEGNFYDKYNSKNIIEKTIMKNFFNNIKIAIDSIEFSSMLDVGCGEGYITEFIYQIRQCNKIEGIDISPRIIEEAALRIPLAKFSIGSALSIDRPDGSYEIVVASEVLEHLTEPDTALKEIFRVTSKYALVSVPNEPVWRICNMARGKYIGDLGNTPGHIQHWSSSQFIKLVSKYGIIEKVLSPFPWSMLLCQKFE